MTIDWSRPIEAVHEDGRVEAARAQRVRGYTSHYVSRGNLTPQFGAFVNDEGEPVEPSSWRVRNVVDHIPDAGKMVLEHPTPTQYAPELVERMVALCRMIAGPPLAQGNIVGLATAIVSDLPQEVDPDEEEAARIAMANAPETFPTDTCGLAGWIKLGIARGRQLERGDEA